MYGFVVRIQLINVKCLELFLSHSERLGKAIRMTIIDTNEILSSLFMGRILNMLFTSESKNL